MPEYSYPGIYIEGIERGPKPIEGVPTSTAAFIGETERGPTKPRLVTSYKDYLRWFDGVFGDTNFTPYVVNGCFENGGKRRYVCRVTDDAATPAEVVFGNFTVRAVGPGSWGKRVYAKIEESSTTKPGAGANAKPVPVGFRLRLAYYSAPPAKNPLEWVNDPLKKPPFPALAATFDALEMDEQSTNYWYKRLRNNSALAELLRKVGAPPNEIPAPVFGQLAAKGEEGNAVLDVADFQGLAQPPRQDPQGLTALLDADAPESAAAAAVQS